MLQYFFIAIVVACLVLLFRATQIAWPERQPRMIFGVIVVAWLVVIAELAQMGVLAPSTLKPPGNLLVAIIGCASLALLAGLAPGARLAAAVSPAWVVGFQAFRVPVEIFLWLAAAQGLGPELMSWHGRNFDVITGVLALGLGIWLATGRRAPRWVMYGFHVVGLGLLANVVVHAILAIPSPIQQLHTDPPLVFVTQFPYVWLPGFLVPLALAGHVFGLKQLVLPRG